MSDSDRVALVTGGGRGIGRSISLALAHNGVRVAVNYARDSDAADSTAEAIRIAGGQAVTVRAAVQNYSEIATMVTRVRDQLGPIDILIHNAGVASRGNSVLDTDPSECGRLMDVHAFGPFRLTQLVLPDLRSAGRGDIVFISSAVAARNPANSSPYNMAKAAMESLALSLAKEELRHGIHVNIVLPGLVDTDMGNRLIAALSESDDIGGLGEHYPFGHICNPEEVASVVGFLVSQGSSYLTGQRVFVDGGLDVDPATGL